MPCRKTSAGSGTAFPNRPCRRAFGCGRTARTPEDNSRVRPPRLFPEFSHPTLRGPRGCIRRSSFPSVIRAAILCQKLLEARPDIFLPFDQHRLKILGLESRETAHHGTLISPCAGRLNFAVSEK